MLENLTDTEVAFLLYAVEQYHDIVRKDSAYSDKIVEIGGEWRVKLCKEYHKRGIDWTQFRMEE